jgi:hypothetical protein
MLQQEVNKSNYCALRVRRTFMYRTRYSTFMRIYNFSPNRERLSPLLDAVNQLQCNWYHIYKTCTPIRPLHPHVSLSQEKISYIYNMKVLRCPWNLRVDVLQSWSRSCGTEKHLLPQQGFKNRVAVLLPVVPGSNLDR